MPLPHHPLRRRNLSGEGKASRQKDREIKKDFISQTGGCGMGAATVARPSGRGNSPNNPRTLGAIEKVWERRRQLDSGNYQAERTSALIVPVSAAGAEGHALGHNGKERMSLIGRNRCAPAKIPSTEGSPRWTTTHNTTSPAPGCVIIDKETRVLQ